MIRSVYGLALSAALLGVATSACQGGNAAVPSSNPSAAQSIIGSPVDTTSILKMLTKNVTIGSTVDPTNGDKGPHALAVVKATYVLKQGQLLVCNFEDKNGTAGAGTTIDVFDPTPGSKPSTFAENTRVEGCAGVAITLANSVYAAGMTSHLLVRFGPHGILKKAYGAPVEEPFDEADAPPPFEYDPEYIFTSDAKTGSIISLSTGYLGTGKLLQVATGFGVNGKSGWSTLGPSGIQFEKNQNLYIADGVDNTIVYFTHADSLLEKDEIVVEPGGKTFKCPDPRATCGKLVKAGSPLSAPEAMTLLPNGNLIAANTNGNMLVELTPTGQVLDTKVVDVRKAGGIYGLVAVGTDDDNTVLFYTDANTNTLQELEK
jgi:hypothetical protein